MRYFINQPRNLPQWGKLAWNSILICWPLLLTQGCAAAEPDTSPRAIHQLVLHHAWRLNPPPGQARYDASALLRQSPSQWLILNDKGIVPDTFTPFEDQEALTLTPSERLFQNPDWLDQLRKIKGPFDGEGLAQDSQGNLYLSEEQNRWILRYSPLNHTTEILPIDWTPMKKYFSNADKNASVEGIAVGGNRLYVANERSQARIFVVDLETLQIVDDFLVHPKKVTLFTVHYSDLAWYQDHLYILVRDEQVILQVDPHQHRVLSEYHYDSIENAREHRYNLVYPTGIMEGLWVDESGFWLLTDNNGLGRKADPTDKRPTLFHCVLPPHEK